MIVRHMIKSHPATQAAQITSDALRALYNEYRDNYGAARRKLERGLDLIERVHARVSKTHVDTPDAWREWIP